MLRNISYWKNAHQLEIILGIILIVIFVVSVSRDRKWFFKKIKDHKKYRIFILGMAIIYIIGIFYVTVFSRVRRNEAGYNLELFWSYKQFFRYEGIRLEIILNILLFIPLGYLLAESFGILIDRKLWNTDSCRKKCVRKIMIVILIGCTVSVFIEILQYYRHCGLAEFDDIISNSLGNVIGCLLHLFLCLVSNHIREKYSDI